MCLFSRFSSSKTSQFSFRSCFDQKARIEIVFTLVSSGIRKTELIKCLCSIIFCEAFATCGVIVAFTYIYALEYLRVAGYAIFASGIIVGFANLEFGLCVGIIGSSCALPDAKNSSLFIKILVIEIFESALRLLGVIVGIIMQAQATWPAKAV
ncbi:V-ATPase proteolipid subunit [Trema orientale]|uniref:V-ATPase proteolipid subunit n=1 Tax=Trema orientale TaxID=63057 RepID=A0A2P5EYY5_TREOI|nr:V-ATPase proteolipid subunit [Trema orientale]